MKGERINLERKQPKILDAEGKRTVVDLIGRIKKQELPFSIFSLEVREDDLGQTIIHIAAETDEDSASYLEALASSLQKKGLILEQKKRDYLETRVEEEYIVHK